MDIDRLMVDLEYAIDMSVMVMADFKRMYGHKEKNWWSRYNSSKLENRIKYEQKVAQFL